jgi:hypothetical protein
MEWCIATPQRITFPERKYTVTNTFIDRIDTSPRAMPETTPLLSSSGGSHSSDFYFLNSSGEASASREAAVDLEPTPSGADANEFAPKLLGPRRKVRWKILYSVIL